jgi:hypothetical protein
MEAHGKELKPSLWERNAPLHRRQPHSAALVKKIVKTRIEEDAADRRR